MSWIDAVVVPAPPPLTDCDAVVKPCIAGRFWIRSVTVVTPDFLMSSLVMVWIGSAPSSAMRLIAEPVISTRWTGVALSSDGAAWAMASDVRNGPQARATAPQIFVRWNMESTPGRGGGEFRRANQC